MSQSLRLFIGSALADGTGFVSAPGAVLVEVSAGRGLSEPVGACLAAGTVNEVFAHAASASAERIDLGDVVLVPGLVNAHTHLDLTHIGACPYDEDPVTGGFAGWARMIIGARLGPSTELTESVRAGIAKSLAGGVVAVGDIAGVMLLEPVRALHESVMMGTSFLEYFGLGTRQEETAAKVEALLKEAMSGGGASGVRVGLQPHAPYTAGRRLYEWTAGLARERGVPVTTHLAENDPERRFIARGEGPFRSLLEGLGLWNESILADVSGGMHPLAHLERSLRMAPWLLAHVNDCDDAGLAVLAESGATVAYCPRSSWYFKNHEMFGGHRYREMMKSGVRVALGTDSIVNLPRDEADRISTLDEMRFLYARDGVSPEVLMRMGTMNGAEALGLSAEWFKFGGGRGLAGLNAVDVRGVDAGLMPLERVMRARGAPRLLLTPKGFVSP